MISVTILIAVPSLYCNVQTDPFGVRLGKEKSCISWNALMGKATYIEV